MKTIVVYKSKTGFTKKYAQWIAEQLSADIFNISEVNINTLIKYDTIIYGGSLYAVGILGIDLINKNIDKLKDKKILVFATGVSPLSDKAINDITSKNFTQEQLKFINFFYLRGGFNYNKLNFFDKFLMTLLKWKIKSKKKEELIPDETLMLSIFHESVDYTKKENINELISFIKK